MFSQAIMYWQKRLFSHSLSILSEVIESSRVCIWSLQMSITYFDTSKLDGNAVCSFRNVLSFLNLDIFSSSGAVVRRLNISRARKSGRVFIYFCLYTLSIEKLLRRCFHRIDCPDKPVILMSHISEALPECTVECSLWRYRRRIWREQTTAKTVFSRYGEFSHCGG